MRTEISQDLLNLTKIMKAGHYFHTDLQDKEKQHISINFHEIFSTFLFFKQTRKYLPICLVLVVKKPTGIIYIIYFQATAKHLA